MHNYRTRATCGLAIVLVLANGKVSWGQGARPPYDPIITETPWGQHVVAPIRTYIDIQIYEQLKPGQPWSVGEPLAKKLEADYKAGTLKVRRYPWRIMDGFYALGLDNEEQQIYLLDTGAGLLLIDPSYDAWQDDLAGEMRALGYNPSQVKWVLLTHCHYDHSQSAHTWHEGGAKIIVGDGDAHPVESGNILVATWVEPDKTLRHFTPSPVDQHVFDGDVLQFGNITLYAISTPGHTPGSTCFYLHRGGKDILVSGDIVLHNGRHAWMESPHCDWDQYLTSLGKLANYAREGNPIRFDILLPGHGTVDMDDGQRSVEETVKIVRNIVFRRRSGEKIVWIETYPWNWSQGITYTMPK